MYNNIFNKNISIIIPSRIFKNYPSSFPQILFTLGNKNILNSTCVSIIGTRNSSFEGNNLAFNIAKNLSQENICIISGLASGIDSHAHLGTLFNNKETIAFIAHGFFHIPNNKIKLVQNILNSNGLIISEYFPDTPPQKYYYLKRNQLIAYFSKALIIVECPLKSGAMYTANYATSLNKTIFSVPWNLLSLKGKGTNILIQKGANIFTSCSQIFNFLNVTNIKYTTKKESRELPENYISLYNFIKKNSPVQKEYIYTNFSSKNISILNAEISFLEINNFIYQKENKIYIKI